MARAWRHAWATSRRVRARDAAAVLAALSVAAAAWHPSPTRAGPPDLRKPVACAVGDGCFVQNYVDQRAGTGYADFTCGAMSYDGHAGTDVRVPSIADMRDGTPVVAAAPGVVTARRDGMPDAFYDQLDPTVIQGREAGNGVVIDHGDGWVTQYSHLRRGSVAVRRGDRVAAGDRLGLIGLSGKTEFPHVEVTVRHDGEPVDPYTGTAPETGCGGEAEPLWTDETRRAMAYEAGGLLARGFSATPVEARDIVAGDVPSPRGAESRALVFWVHVYGAREGDREHMRLIGPEGRVVAEFSGEVPRDKADWVRYVGKRRLPRPADGRYTGHYTLTRESTDGSTTVVDTRATVRLR